MNGRQPGEVPKGCECLTAFIDVHDDLLFWAVCGWESDFTGYGIEYGAFPSNRKRYYTLATAQPTLQQQFSGGGKEIAIFAGLEYFAADLLRGTDTRDDGSTLADRPAVDRQRVCQRNRRLRDPQVEPDHGCHAVQGRRGSPQETSHSANTTASPARSWATIGESPPRTAGAAHREHGHQLLEDLASRPAGHPAMGDRGCFQPLRHRPHRPSASGRPLERGIPGADPRAWPHSLGMEDVPGGADNHLLDCFVGLAVGASMLNIQLPGSISAPTARQAPMKLSGYANSAKELDDDATRLLHNPTRLQPVPVDERHPSPATPFANGSRTSAADSPPLILATCRCTW